ncbi:family 1 encapsulin nanocompartment shell protein [Eubacterium aggregans]|uniref:family 1 encapsulin nanocompartment shell protein n=1 Tax=Eubacterium aggregans TaxID=81409 RepID=UPI0023F46B72|nr:family 1 encapsulin nanocompartment shell protein [Eubacterium aggregans]MDD4691911.1 family 1 encapsulin nanocompartment shell protein [Eubacterium aggregans]
MDYLGRTTAPFGDTLWNDIDTHVVKNAKKFLVGRHLMPLYGPLGAGILEVNVDTKREEAFDGGIARTCGRSMVDLLQIYEDFWLFWRDLEEDERLNTPVDLSSVDQAAQTLAQREDEIIFFGQEQLGIKGLCNSEGVITMARDDWSVGQDAFLNITKGISQFYESGIIGHYALAMGPDLYYSLQRILPETGVMEIDRIRGLLDGRVYVSRALMGKAILLCGEAQFMDLAIGQDMTTAYVEYAELNHHFRVLETLALRLKVPQAVIVY